MGSLELILNDNVDESPTPVGIMTTENREKWAEIREKMISYSSRNLKTIEEVDSALMVFSLDDVDNLGQDPERVLRQFLHSTGTNRY